MATQRNDGFRRRDVEFRILHSLEEAPSSTTSLARSLGAEVTLVQGALEELWERKYIDAKPSGSTASSTGEVNYLTGEGRRALARFEREAAGV